MASRLPGGGEALDVRLDSGDEATDGHPVHAARWRPSTSGDGPPIIAVHGLAGSHLNWASLAPLAEPQRVADDICAWVGQRFDPPARPA